ncbi:MAG: U32 family peptidase C-terminal domain-containing protein [Thermoanaerobacteraceae bacterium]|nr:U32 family peptidase C-terminal domain-containing protein [Thermoanaerobacteraceae bacterium]
MRKIELLAPAGDLERLKAAFYYGADAVYIGGKRYGLRAGSNNFTMDEIREGVRYAHEKGGKVYLTLNIIPHNEDLIGLDEFIKDTFDAGIDAFIVSDPGIFTMVKNVAPIAEIHISTQANNTNWMSAAFWHSMGAKRVVLARELSIEEIKEIRSNVPDTLELEAFVHGAMCISYSGRCLLSNFLTGRDANKGECTHPCRWKYYLTEEKRPGEYFPVFEDERGSYIMNSKDLCMIKYLPELVDAGVSSLKIEGRNKGIYYVAVTVDAYRKALDAYLNDPTGYRFDESLLEELYKASTRDFTTGFYFSRPGPEEHNYDKDTHRSGYDFIGMVRGYDREKKMVLVEQRNRFFENEDVEVLTPNGVYPFNTGKLYDTDFNEIDAAPHAQQMVWMGSEREFTEFDILRRKKA